MEYQHAARIVGRYVFRKLTIIIIIVRTKNDPYSRMMPVLYELGHFRFRFSCLSVQSIMHTLENSLNRQTTFHGSTSTATPLGYFARPTAAYSFEWHETKNFAFHVRGRTNKQNIYDKINEAPKNRLPVNLWVFLAVSQTRHTHTYANGADFKRKNEMKWNKCGEEAAAKNISYTFWHFVMKCVLAENGKTAVSETFWRSFHVTHCISFTVR